MSALFSTTATNWQLPLRFCLFFVFWMHGSQKVLGLYGGPGLEGFSGYVAAAGMPAALGYVGAFAEFLGAFGMLFGFMTRLAALGILFVMGTATFVIHWQWGFFMNWLLTHGRGHGYEFSMTLMMVALALLIGGGGNLSVDKKLASRSRSAA